MTVLARANARSAAFTSPKTITWMPRVAVYDWLVKHPHIDKDRVVLWGISFGTYFGLQAAAALGDRIKGAAVTFVCHEPGMNGAHGYVVAVVQDALHVHVRLRRRGRSSTSSRRNSRSIPTSTRSSVRCSIQAGEDDELSPIEFTDELDRKDQGSPRSSSFTKANDSRSAATIRLHISANTGSPCSRIGASTASKAKRRRMKESLSMPRVKRRRPPTDKPV